MMGLEIFRQKPLSGPRFLGKILGAVIGFAMAFSVIVAIEWIKKYLFS